MQFNCQQTPRRACPDYKMYDWFLHIGCLIQNMSPNILWLSISGHYRPHAYMKIYQSKGPRYEALCSEYPQLLLKSHYSPLVFLYTRTLQPLQSNVLHLGPRCQLVKISLKSSKFLSGANFPSKLSWFDRRTCLCLFLFESIFVLALGIRIAGAWTSGRRSSCCTVRPWWGVATSAGPTGRSRWRSSGARRSCRLGTRPRWRTSRRTTRPSRSTAPWRSSSLPTHLSSCSAHHTTPAWERSVRQNTNQICSVAISSYLKELNEIFFVDISSYLQEINEI